MKKTLMIALLVFGFAPIAKADTIDYWHVYLNKTRIGDFNSPGRNQIVLKLNSLTTGDSVTVRYFNDTPFDDCITYLTIETEKHHVLLSSTGKGTSNPISFTIDELVKLRKLGHTQPFEFFYWEGKLQTKSDKHLIFRIQFE
jgi:hypothetical protein